MFFLFPYSLETFGETKPHEVGVDSYHMIFFMSFTRPWHWSQNNYLASANESDQWCKQVQIYRKDHDMMLLQIRTSSHQNNLQLIAFVIWHYVLDLMFWFFNEG